MFNCVGLHKTKNIYVAHGAIAFSLWVTLMVTSLSLSSPLAASLGLQPQACATCHQSQHAQWQSSHHAKAMMLPTSQTVKADFNNTDAQHKSQFARFFIKDNRYMAAVWSGDAQDVKNAVTYQVDYTFGVYPLQQYLVSTGKGHRHVLPFAWDTRDEKAGGQRWMHLYDTDITQQDRLHWQQPLQNWNGMCADCHSDDVRRNYNPSDDSFDTTWAHISVGCSSCHDDLAGDHAKTALALSPKATQNSNKTNESPVGQWLRKDNARVAAWQGAPRDNSFMDGCYACHALRSPLTDGFDSDKPFLDQFMPTYTNTPIYHADGQIKEEAYVYGSFKQSKMHARGVNCLDCHNSHTYELKFEGNKVCTQCHSPNVFDTTLHHGHKQNTEAAMCVTCHMPATTYMNVDARRDHSFKVPRPDISHAYNTPNACSSCHTDKSAKWASNAISAHAAKDGLATTQPLSANERALLDLQSGQALGYDQHLSLVRDITIAPIRRAGALAMFRYMPMLLNPRDAKPFINHENPLIRLAVIDALEDQPHYIKVNVLAPLLNDALKSVRVKAAFALVGASLPAKYTSFFEKAFIEWQISNLQMQFRGESHVNAALVAQKQQNQQAAIDAYLKSINVDPYFDPAYVNLSDIYRQTGQVEKEASLLARGVSLLPQSAVLHYGYGLYFVRQKQLPEAIKWLRRAHSIDNANTQYAYMYYLALHTQGDSEKAWCQLQKYIKNYRQQNLIDLAQGIQAALLGRANCSKF